MKNHHEIPKKRHKREKLSLHELPRWYRSIHVVQKLPGITKRMHSWHLCRSSRQGVKVDIGPSRSTQLGSYNTQTCICQVIYFLWQFLSNKKATHLLRSSLLRAVASAAVPPPDIALRRTRRPRSKGPHWSPRSRTFMTRSEFHKKYISIFLHFYISTFLQFYIFTFLHLWQSLLQNHLPIRHPGQITQNLHNVMMQKCRNAEM